MKKVKMPRELAYVFGMLLMPFAVALTVRADLGMSMIASPTYIISEKVSFLSYGMTEYIVQGLLLVLMCIIIRKFRWAYLTSFISAVIYGTLLDIACALTAKIPADNIAVRVIFFIAGMVLTAISVAFFFNTYLAPCVYDFFVRVVGVEKKLDMRKWKLCFDFSMLGISVALSLVLFKGFVGINFGTLVMAALNGNIIAFFLKLMKKHFAFFDWLPIAKYFEG